MSDGSKQQKRFGTTLSFPDPEHKRRHTEFVRRLRQEQGMTLSGWLYREEGRALRRWDRAKQAARQEG